MAELNGLEVPMVFITYFKIFRNIFAQRLSTERRKVYRSIILSFYANEMSP